MQKAEKSVVYLSSELEEFIGFATRVIVFRNGSQFDAFVGKHIDPKSILEAMFGQTDRQGLLRDNVGEQKTETEEINMEYEKQANDFYESTISLDNEVSDVESITNTNNAFYRPAKYKERCNMTDVTIQNKNFEEVNAKAGSGTTPYLLMPITVLFILIIIAVIRSPSLMSSFGIGSAIIVSAPLILATYALMTTVTAGRGTIDLAIGPLIGFINVSVIQLIANGVIGFTNFCFLVCDWSRHCVSNDYGYNCHLCSCTTNYCFVKWFSCLIWNQPCYFTPSWRCGPRMDV